MAIAARGNTEAVMPVTGVGTHALASCEGCRVESRDGLVGWVEETWLDPVGEPAALALRTTDGRRALLPAADVAALDTEHGWVLAASGARLLELDAPRVERGGSPLAASWRTTGAVLPPPRPARGLRRAALAFGLRQVRASPPARPSGELTLWQAVAILYGTIAFLVVFVTALAFLVARLATGHAY